MAILYLEYSSTICTSSTGTSIISRVGLDKTGTITSGELENNAWCCVRPSGTEPKIKFYFGVKGTSLEDAAKKLEKLKNAMVTA